ncbi:MAG: enoyl-CoA hydratase/isomerase family protein [Proteobacteria bacterium]|nr:enoyl-CoA hydratase/isomerase family protein [Pseudomonadota bacterium]
MGSINAVVDLAIEDGIAVLTVDNPPVNALSADVRAGLDDGIRRAGQDPKVEAVVIWCAGRTFIAGADITEFGKPPRDPSLPALLDTIEACPKPVVAAIHGTALGGGLETALASNWRIAAPTAKMGLPEVKLGLLPGAGGTQRLPRLVGVQPALEMITSGTPVGAKQALAMGLVDEIAEGDLKEAALAFARRAVSEGRPLRKIRDLKVDATPEVFAEFRKANARKFRGFEAPEACIQAVEAAVSLPVDEGLKRERELFMKLVSGDQSRAQRHVFFAEREVARIPDIAADTPTLPVAKAGVVGAGTMGGGIAMNFLNAGIPTTIVETQQAALDRGVATIRKNYESTAKKGRMTQEDVEKRMALLTPSLALEDLADCDLVIEAVFELMEVKKEVFGKLDRIVKPGAILATNTSYLDVNEIAASTSRPELVVGLHFFSPANVMKLLEVVRGKETSKPVVATAMKLGKTLGKVAVQVGVCHGFVGNRMLAARQREAQKLLVEGAMPWDVDRVLLDFGFPMGPFAMGDLAGLDLGWKKETSTSSTIREILNEMDRRGQKTGAGFYDYDENRKASPSPVVEKVILDFAAKQGVERRQISDQEILERCLYPMVNEGAKILEEGVALRSSDIDIVWIYGYGWPVYRGGLMFWADLVGPAVIAERMHDFQARFGDDFKVSPLLDRLAKDGGKFADLK